MKVAKLKPNAQEIWLQKAAEQNWSPETLEQKIKDAEKERRATEDDELEQENPEGYRVAQARKKALKAQYEFEKITKANPSLENCIQDIIADPQYLADLDDRTIAKLIKEATRVDIARRQII
jgi:hypothetical protein